MCDTDICFLHSEVRQAREGLLELDQATCILFLRAWLLYAHLRSWEWERRVQPTFLLSDRMITWDPKASDNQEMIIFRHTFWYACISRWPHKNAEASLPDKDCEQKQKWAIKTHSESQGIWLCFCFWFYELRAKGSFCLLILFHYNNYSVNIVLVILLEVWGTSWMMRIQIYYFLK